jgi:hypothetical protein
MRKFTFSGVLVFVSIIVLQSCYFDNHLLTPPPVPDQSFTEEFDTVSAAIDRGWEVINASSPMGSNVWQQGGGLPPWFPAWSNNGTNVGFIGADYTSTSAAAGIISNWLVSPPVLMQNGDKIEFFTRALLYDYLGDSTDFVNTLMLMVNTHNTGNNVGSGGNSGDFDKTLVAINSGYKEYLASNPDPEAYPGRWTRFEGTVSGLNEPTWGRFAFRYFINGGGWNGLGSGVAIDQVKYTSVNH